MTSELKQNNRDKQAFKTSLFASTSLKNSNNRIKRPVRF